MKKSTHQYLKYAFFKIAIKKALFVYKKLKSRNLMEEVLPVGLLVFLSFYTFLQFHKDSEVIMNPGLFLFYFLPSIIISLVLFFAVKHKRSAGLLFIIVSYGLFFPYKISIGFLVSIILFITGLLYLTDKQKKRNRIYVRRS